MEDFTDISVNGFKVLLHSLYGEQYFKLLAKVLLVKSKELLTDEANEIMLSSLTSLKPSKEFLNSFFELVKPQELRDLAFNNAFLGIAKAGVYMFDNLIPKQVCTFGHLADFFRFYVCGLTENNQEIDASYLHDVFVTIFTTDDVPDFPIVKWDEAGDIKKNFRILLNLVQGMIYRMRYHVNGPGVGETNVIITGKDLQSLSKFLLVYLLEEVIYKATINYPMSVEIDASICLDFLFEKSDVRQWFSVFSLLNKGTLCFALQQRRRMFKHYLDNSIFENYLKQNILQNNFPPFQRATEIEILTLRNLLTLNGQTQSITSATTTLQGIPYNDRDNSSLSQID